MKRRLLLTLTGLALMTGSQGGCSDEPPHDEFAAALLAELVATNTAPSGGNDMRPAVALLVRHLKDAGFGDDDIFAQGQTAELQNLVVRLRSQSPARKPVLLMAHMDVVEALAEDWNYEPFRLTEDDGYYYGRGSIDNKAGVAILVANLIRLKEEGFEPDRDLIVMLTADEESTGRAVRWLLDEHRDIVDAGFALNTDGGPVLLVDGKPAALMLQTSEKIYASFALEATDPGGHSSRPQRDSAISRLARALVDLEAYEFPIELNETTRAFFKSWSLVAPEDAALFEQVLSDNPDAGKLDKLLDEPYYNAVARTTCVATQLSGGHAENALPQSARAVVNCRFLPQSDISTVAGVLQDLSSPWGVTVTGIGSPTPSPPSPLTPEIVDPISALARSLWPDIVVIPEMSTGATDGAFVRNAGVPAYAA
ncbi:MAG: M20/M25/M40 family metallo-hydrolase, partial [Gammaproteobacteria bacterium]|nr:M20/M25/M40 family metallo-hydrolase [Gammaproteobacteria bacterium]